MTVSILHCWKKRSDSPRRRTSCWLALLVLWATLVCSMADAAGLEFRYTELVASEQEYLINAAVNLQMRPRLQEMVEAGVAIPFRAEFSLTRPRWYWFSETVAEQVLDLSLSYHALTRQYRVKVGGLNRNFSSFDEAMRALLSLHNWSVVERNRLRDGETYSVSLRFRLDVASLPKPFQVAALGSRDLDLTTGWTSWALQIPREPR
ncbi:MAG: hypothetical protein RJA63_1176 [Pseudomonadota bacterium]|jgi:hypothetical protein|nr:DUF4390 domain-containing protein [Uliginosibacterium sp.]MBK9393427.1 DUF4390 domain-containing protein [Uliginosibacterium sp.]